MIGDLDMANFYDIYLYKEPESEGHAANECYAHVPVIDPEDGLTILAYLCRINEEQYNYILENNIEFRTWETLPKTGTKSRIKKRVKDKDGNETMIPTITFGDSINSPPEKPENPENTEKSLSELPL